MSRVGASGTTDIVDCYRSTGIFFCADHLQHRGIDSPSRVMVLVGHCLQACDRPPLSSSTSAEACMSACLDAASERYGPTLPTSLDALAPPPDQPARWSPFNDFAELMNARSGPTAYESVRKRLTRTGLNAPLDLLHDVAIGFVDTALPRALRTFDPARGEGRETAWLTTVFYRYAVHTLIAQRSTDSIASALEDARSEGPAPDVAFEASSREDTAAEINGALERLDPMVAAPLRLYFGFDGPELTVRDIARRLRLSDYRARALLVRGLATLAARLQVRDVLDERELQIARAIFVDGQTAAAAGDQLQLRPAQIRASLASMQAKLAAVLRDRRSVRSPLLDTSMQNETCLDLTTIVDLWTRGTPVRIETDRQERVVVLPAAGAAGGTGSPSASSIRVPVAALLHSLSRRPELVARLDAAGVDLGGLIAPAPTRQRPDRPPDFDAWDSTLADVARQAATVARAVAELWRGEAATRTVALAIEPDEATRRVQAALAAVAGGLEESLPLSARREGRATLEIRTSEGRSQARWLTPEERPAVDLRSLAQFAASVAGIELAAGGVLAEIVEAELRIGRLTLPDYEPATLSRETATYTWKDETLRAVALAR